MGKYAQKVKYIHNFARTLAGQLKISSQEFARCSSAEQVADRIWLMHMLRIKMRVTELSAEIRGGLAAAGYGSPETLSGAEKRVKLIDVAPPGHWIGSRWQLWSGDGLLTEIASFAVVAAMADNMWAEIDDDKKYWPTKNP